MTQRSLSLAILLVLAGTLVWFAARDSQPSPAEPALDGQVQPAPARQDTELAPAGGVPALAATTKVETRRAPLRTESTQEAPLIVPDDAHWVRGRLLLPSGTPSDERPTIIARGSRFGGERKSSREYRTQVDANGEFRLAFDQATKTGSVRIESRYLYLDERLRIEPSAQTGELLLEPKLGARIVGQVKAEAALASHADIHSDLKVLVQEGIQMRSAKVGDDGNFELDAIPPGEHYRADLQSTELHGESRMIERLRPGQTLELALFLRRGVRVAGRIIGTAGEPLEGETVELVVRPSGASARERAALRQTVRCKQNGHFVFRGAPAGSAQLVLRSEGYAELIEDIGVLANGQAAQDLLLTPKLGGSIAGHVRWPDGKPAPGVRVSVRQAELESKVQFGDRTFSAKTDERGAFRVDGLGAGNLVLDCSTRPLGPDGKKLRGKERGPLWKARLADQAPNQTGLLLELSEGRTLRGTVSDQQGQPVEAFSVQLVAGSELPDFASPSESVARDIVSAAGEFEISGLTDGDWQLQVQVPGGAYFPWRTVRIPRSTTLAIIAARGVTLSGTIQTPTGEPVAGAMLRVQVKSGNSITTLVPRAENASDEQGAFQLTGLDPGEILISAEATGWGPSTALSFHLDDGDSRDNVQLILRRPARITGELHPAAGTLENRRVTLLMRTPYISMETRTDARGHFAFEDLRPGEYRTTLLATREDTPRGTAQQAQTVESAAQIKLTVADGGSAHVILGAPPANPIRVHGRVTVGGRPATRATLRCMSNGFFFDAGTFSDTQTNSAGEYEIQVDVAGDYEFRIAAQGFETRLRRTIETAPQQRFDFELGASEISGYALRPDGEAATDIQVTLNTFAEPEFLERSVQTDSEGRFRFGLLGPETYYVRAGGGTLEDPSAAEYALFRSANMVLEEGQSVTGFVLQLSKAGSVTGIVYDASGRPAINVGILVKDAAGNYLSTFSQVMTGTDGRFELLGLPAGQLTLTAFNMRGEMSESSVRIVAGESVSTVLRFK